MEDIRLPELNDNELQNLKFFVDAEIKIRSDRKLTEQAHKLANTI
jgi:cytidylate kinase